MKTWMELDEEARLISGRPGTFRHYGDRKPEKFLDLFGPSLDEARLLSISFPGAPHVAHELTAGRTGLNGRAFL
ncbi:MAG: hypothetical protein L0Y78_04790 [candidate division NC10 bacterium]|nr:hypothetical protein [candidate division NC10 bacterium]